MSTLHPRSPSAPLRIILLWVWSTFLIDDSLPCCPVSACRLRSFIVVRSTLKSDGRFTPAGVRCWQRPSASHSATDTAAQTNGADPSYLPAASAEGGGTLGASSPRAMAVNNAAFMVSLSDWTRGTDTGCSSVHCVAAGRHACTEGAVVVAASP